MKRWRAPKAKPGELKIVWGKFPHNEPEVCVAWGEGTSKRDAILALNNFSRKQMRLPIGDEKAFCGVVFDDSFLEELKARGYDLTTIKFSIQKLKDDPKKS